MALTTGIRIGSYEIKTPLGEGGMGVVYRAHDTRLGRDVAIKALPDAFADDADRLQRFQREAQVLASLNHPNIAHIYGLEQAEKTQCIVMELVEGETLQERLKRGPIPLDQALPIAKQIAEALEAAHERGIVHRDLKPGNVMLSRDGKVKVLDFGLAKAYDTQNSPALSHSPTMVSMGATNAGIILGTAAYMSPEQARGMTVDRRTDIFAFGAVLYEILTGQQAFHGEMVSDILASVLKVEPDWTRLPADPPAAIQRLLRRCLIKNANGRLQAIGEARIAIEETVGAVYDRPQSLPETSPAVIDRRHRAGSRLPWILVAALSAIVLTLATPAVRYLRQPSTDVLEMRVEINTPSTPAPLDFALSPNGRYIAFVASGDGAQRLWLRALDKTEAQPMSGTEGAVFPFWSPDSRSIAFTAAGKLKRIDIAGGPPQAIASTSVSRGGAWNGEGTILFNTNIGPVFRVSDSGGEPVAATRLDPTGQTGHSNPQFLPDGRHFLYYAYGTAEKSGLYLASLGGSETKWLAAADTGGMYLTPDMVIFVRQTSLMAQHLDLKRGELTGNPIRLADPIGSNGLGFGAFSVSTQGQVAYRGNEGGLRQLRWHDRAGKTLGVAGSADGAIPLYPELSPDGNRVTLQRVVQNNLDVWIMDFVRANMTRFTFDASLDSSPLWSPDGMRIVFESARGGSNDLYLKPASGASAEELLLKSPDNKWPQDWSKDGRFLLYGDTDMKTGRDIWALPVMEKDRKPIAVVKTPFDELNGQFSPDGRWVAYETNESGRVEIVVQPFPNPTGKWQVSTGGGTQPRWRPDGKELYFIAEDGKLTAVSVNSGETFTAGPPAALFPVALPPGLGNNKQEYMVSHDGRFLVNELAETSTVQPITLILNWRPPKQ